jgi:RND superfamily putative drug exporter
VTFGVLALGYQSLLLALKAIVLNVASVAAAFGGLVLVFQDGIGGAWLGLTAPTGGVFPNIPILVFCIVFGLSMDYEVFLFNRIPEAHREGHDDPDAMTIGLSTTASVISSAALIMVVVFLGFCWGNFLLIKMLGFTLAAAVLIDVTLVRLVIGPALFALAGRWNWWPRI